MGMTIDEHIAQLKKLKSFHNGSYGASINFAMETMRKYQMFQLDYEAKLKADMVAMLTEILTDFDNLIEPNSTRIDCESIIEQKIQALEGKSDGEK